jgi:glycosyltransferase involved in cell wall biosynthesis
VAVVKLVVAAFALPILLTLVLWRRLTARRGGRPRVVWGTSPIISIKYWSAGLAELGYDSMTYVDDLYDINAREDFDRHRDRFLPPGMLFEPLRDFAAFLWALQHADVVSFFLDSGFLRHTTLRRLELPLLRLAGLRILVSPYGTDIAVPGFLGPFEEAMVADYPSIARDAAATKRQVDHVCRWAHVVVRNLQTGYLPRHDVVWPSMVAIDTEQWRPAAAREQRDELSVVHAPNHRRLKGTDAVIAAVEELRAEGVPLRLDLLERRPNAEVRAALQRADIVVEQLIGGYALFAIEALASGVPVVSRLSWLAPPISEHPALRECPIVDADEGSLKDVLRSLAADEARRRRLGEAGRRYAVERHSARAVAEIWAALIEGRPLPAELQGARRPDAILRA